MFILTVNNLQLCIDLSWYILTLSIHIIPDRFYIASYHYQVFILNVVIDANTPHSSKAEKANTDVPNFQLFGHKHVVRTIGNFKHLTNRT